MINSVKTYHGPKVRSTVSSNTSIEHVTKTQGVVQPLPDLKALLQSLDPKQREQLIAEVFESDLTTIVKTESERGYQKGLKDAQDQLDKITKEQNEQFGEQTEQFSKLISKIEQLTPNVSLHNEGDVYEVIVLAVFKLLGERLEQGDYLKHAVERAIEECIVSKEVSLCLSTQDYLLVMSCLKTEYSEDDLAKVKIKEDKRMSIGDTRLELANGSIEQNFTEKLNAWCENLAKFRRESNLG
ncbi:FliH/SctL family protein [Pseudoalteromonas piscicida]|uniref:FliH/SctL family protein n=1 Tax=Pseudoalteromonas piscicida TaxID=43662 RepID=UPI003C7DBDB3